MTRHEYWLLAALLLSSFLLHFAGLGHPREVIFDEVHFGKFITAYCCTGERFFDIHPPHAKLLIAGVAWLGGYRGGFSFETIGQPYGDIPVVALRALPAATGTLLPMIIFVLLRQLGVGPRLALLGGALIVLDNALLIQTRIIALDGLLLLSTLGSVSLFLAAQRATGTKRAGLLMGAGGLAGLAVGTKFTGLAALALLGVLLLVEALKPLTFVSLRRAAAASLLVGSAVVVVYLAGWVAHFALLPLPGPGDAFHVPATLLPPHTPNPVSFFRETITLHKIMFEANYNLAAGHPHASPWWSWPFMQVPVFYWINGGAQIYFVGNPIVWWGAALLFIVAIAVSVVQFGQRRRPQRGMFWLPVVGFCIAMLPLIRVPRALFLYHYLTPMIFSLMAGLVWLERYQAHHHWPARRLRYVLAGTMFVALLGFLLLSPLTYGISLGSTATQQSRAGQLLFWVDHSP